MTFPKCIFLLIISFISLGNKNETKSIINIDLSNHIVNPKNYIVGKTSEVLNINGIADEKCWKTASSTNSFIDIEGLKIPKYDTNVKMLWDENNLYIFAQLEEQHIWGNLLQHDTLLFLNNDFEVFIDPKGTGQNYGEIEINALGTIWDLTLDKPYRVGGKANNAWELSEMKTAIKIHGTLNNPYDIDSMWTIEMALPIKYLLELNDNNINAPKENDQWRINFLRVNWEHDIILETYYRKKENAKYLPENNWVWSNQNAINLHEPEKWGTIQFTNNKNTDDVKFIEDEDWLVKQIAFALFRQTHHGKLKYLFKNDHDFLQKINAHYSDNVVFTALFKKTKIGYKIIIESPFTHKKYSINQDGFLTLFE